MVGLIVPVKSNFKGFTKLMATVDMPICPYVINNWDHNYGVPYAWNAGIKWAIDEDVVIIANDDIEFASETISGLLDIMFNFDAPDLCSAVTTDTGQFGFTDRAAADFCCFAIKPKQFVDKFGWFDEHFTPAYFEDNDMAYRVKVGGGRQGVGLSCRVVHHGSVTQYWGGEEVVTSPMFEANRAYYKAKWGGVPGEETYLTPFNQPNLTIKDI